MGNVLDKQKAKDEDLKRGFHYYIGAKMGIILYSAQRGRLLHCRGTKGHINL